MQNSFVYRGRAQINVCHTTSQRISEAAAAGKCSWQVLMLPGNDNRMPCSCSITSKDASGA